MTGPRWERKEHDGFLSRPRQARDHCYAGPGFGWHLEALGVHTEATGNAQRVLKKKERNPVVEARSEGGVILWVVRGGHLPYAWLSGHVNCSPKSPSVYQRLIYRGWQGERENVPHNRLESSKV